ncbi:MAG: EscU/YscU/HrcU family type III secretion system export apparatus switch protein [Myxococcota bacterium]
MSDGGTGEKTEEASPQRLKQARDKGQVAKSQDLIGGLMFISTFVVLAATLKGTLVTFEDYIRQSISVATEQEPSIATSLNFAYDAVRVMLMSSLPVLGVAFIMAMVSNYMQVGFLFTVEPLKPELQKINPISGLKNMVSKKKIIELIKQLIKFTIIGYICFDSVRDRARDVVMLSRMPLHHSITVAGDIFYDLTIKVAAVFLAIAFADFFYQRWQFSKDNMMSKYDVKQEYKQSEGDPEMKHQRKALAEELIMHGSQENVRHADAVITNPAHIAVAIKYDPEKGGAPTIVAKGMRKNAEKIKEIARHYNVPILRNVPLAQALQKLDIGEEVPEELYEAVAEVLNFVYELKQKGKV